MKFESEDDGCVDEEKEAITSRSEGVWDVPVAAYGRNAKTRPLKPCEFRDGFRHEIHSIRDNKSRL